MGSAPKPLVSRPLSAEELSQDLHWRDHLVAEMLATLAELDAIREEFRKEDPFYRALGPSSQLFAYLITSVKEPLSSPTEGAI